MKKLIPVIVAVIAILLVAAVAFGQKIIEKYSYSSERADLNEYFEIYCFKQLYSQSFRGHKCDLIAVEKVLTENNNWNEFKNNINAHLTNINSAINKTNPFLQGYVDSVGVKQEVVIPEETKDEVNTEDANVSKVISIEPAEKEILTKVQADDKNEIPKPSNNKSKQ